MRLAPASIPSPPLEWAIIHLGPLAIHTYALCIVTGIVLATIWTNRRLTARGGEPWAVIDIILWAIPLGLLGARLYHVATHPGDFFYPGADPLRIFYIWEGGNAIIGALIGGGVGALIGCRMTGIRLLSFADALAPAMLLAQAVGRLGNYVNHELYGWPTDLPWGLEIESTNLAYPHGLPPGVLFHPTFLYEMIWNLIGIGIILLAERSLRMRWGRAFALYLVWYGLGRMWIESIRVDYSEIVLGLRSNVLGALCLALIGVALFVWASHRHPEPEASVYLPGRSAGDRTRDASVARSRGDAGADEPAGEEPPASAGPEAAGAATSAPGSETSR